MAEIPAWMTSVVREVKLHAEAALLRRLNAGAGFADPRVASQIYLRDEDAMARLAGGTLRPQGTHAKAAKELDAAIAAARIPAARGPCFLLMPPPRCPNTPPARSANRLP